MSGKYNDIKRLNEENEAKVTNENKNIEDTIEVTADKDNEVSEADEADVDDEGDDDDEANEDYEANEADEDEEVYKADEAHEINEINNETKAMNETKEVTDEDEVNEHDERPRCPCDELCEDRRSVKPEGIVTDMWEDILIAFATVDGFKAVR